jgi:hypothetical protein
MISKPNSIKNGTQLFNSFGDYGDTPVFPLIDCTLWRQTAASAIQKRTFSAARGMPLSMAKTAEKNVATPVALTDDVAGMADYVRSPEGREAIERGLADIRQGRTLEGKNALASELKRRAAIRRDA